MTKERWQLSAEEQCKMLTEEKKSLADLLAAKDAEIAGLRAELERMKNERG